MAKLECTPSYFTIGPIILALNSSLVVDTNRVTNLLIITIFYRLQFYNIALILIPQEFFEQRIKSQRTRGEEHDFEMPAAARVQVLVA